MIRLLIVATHGIHSFIFNALIIFSVLLLSTAAQAQTEDDIKLWLKWLGVTEATLQADRIINQEILRLSENGGFPDNLQESMSKALVERTGSTVITNHVVSFVYNNFPKSTNSELAKILKDPLMTRTRNFDVALEMSGAFRKFKTFDNRRRLQDPVSDKRMNLMKQLNQAQRTSIIAALMQTEINITTVKLASKMSESQQGDSGLEWLSLQKQQRERHMSDVIIRLQLFSYRFMKDKELQDYINLMKKSEVQQLLDLSVRAVQFSLKQARDVAEK